VGEGVGMKDIKEGSMKSFFHVTIRVGFDVAHRLLWVGLGDTHLHGHHFIVEATFQSGYHLDEFGMLVDFSVLKRVVEEQVKHWDHKVVLNPDDLLCKVLPIGNRASMSLPRENPTVESMAHLLYQRIAASPGYQNGSNDVYLERVRLYETPDIWVDVTP
jgi:6-pyruvoyl-tetrahydropterin synthase